MDSPPVTEHGPRSAAPLRPQAVPRHGGGRHHVALLGQGRLGSRQRRGLAGPPRADPSGRRLAHLHDLRPDAGLRPRDLAAEDRRPRRAAGLADLRRAARAAARRAGVELPLRHRLDAWTTSTGAASGCSDVLAAAKPSPSAHALEFVSMEVPYIDYLTLQAGLAARRDARLRDGREAAAARARRAGAADHPGDVRLQERQVAGRGSTSSRRSSSATGSNSATTRTPGSAARTGTERDEGRLRPSFLPDRAPAPLGQRARLLLPPRDGADPVPPPPLDARLAAADDPVHPLLGRRRLARRACRRHRPRRAPDARDRTRARQLRPGRPALAARRQGAAGEVQRRPEDQRHRSPRPSRSCSASRACCSGSASRTRATASRAR